MINLRKIKNYISEVDFDREFKADRKRLVILISVEVLLISMTIFVQEYLRLDMGSKPKGLVFAIGILPSFLGSAAYVLFIFVIYRLVQGHYGEFGLTKALVFANGLLFFGLTLWELIRIAIAPFDWWDILASLTGCVAATLLILSLYLGETPALKSGNSD